MSAEVKNMEVDELPELQDQKVLAYTAQPIAV